jgi:hypothetical protein
MAFLHEASKGTTIPELDLFDILPTQTASEYMYKLDVRPMSVVSDGSVVEFVMGGENRDYLCMKGSTIAVAVRLVHQDGSSLHEQEFDTKGLPKVGSAVDEKAVPVNLCLHALWNQVDVFINGYRMTQASDMYAYKAMIKTQLYYGDDAKKTQLTAQGFRTENSDNLDDFTNDNTGYVWRRQLFKGSKVVELEGPLLEDVLQLDKYLLNGMRVQIKLYPALKKFYIMADDVTKDYKIEVVDVVFRACMVKVNPGVLLGHASAMETKNALYQFTRVETKSYSVSSGTSNVYLDNMFQGNRPSKLVFGFVATAAYNGDFKRNPFKFHHYNVTDIRVIVDGQTIPGRPQKVDFDETKQGRKFTQSYVNLYESLGMAGKDYGGGLTPELFAHGHALFVYNLEPTHPSDKYINLKKHANVRLEINFKFPLPETITVVIFAEHTALFEVDNARTIIVSNNN